MHLKLLLRRLSDYMFPRSLADVLQLYLCCSGNLMSFLFLNKCLLSYIMKRLVLEMEATYEG